jgi:hypothetical protein
MAIAFITGSSRLFIFLGQFSEPLNQSFQTAIIMDKTTLVLDPKPVKLSPKLNTSVFGGKDANRHWAKKSRVTGTTQELQLSSLFKSHRVPDRLHRNDLF